MDEPRFSDRGLAPHQFTPMLGVHHPVERTRLRRVAHFESFAMKGMRPSRKVVMIATMLLFAVLVASDIYDFVLHDRGIEYYLREPWRLLLVLAIALVGGGIFAAYDTLTARGRRKS